MIWMPEVILTKNIFKKLVKKNHSYLKYALIKPILGRFKDYLPFSRSYYVELRHYKNDWIACTVSENALQFQNKQISSGNQSNRSYIVFTLDFSCFQFVSVIRAEHSDSEFFSVETVPKKCQLFAKKDNTYSVRKQNMENLGSLPLTFW